MCVRSGVEVGGGVAVAGGGGGGGGGGVKPDETLESRD